MANPVNEEFFEFIWTIDWFSMCPHKPDEFLTSPKFVVQFLGNSEWHMELHPRGLKDNKNIMCFLHRGTGGPDQIDLKYTIAVEESNCEARQTFKKRSASNKSVKIDRSRYLKDLPEDLSEESLKVVCHLRLAGARLPDVPGAIRPYPVFCSAHTLVPVENRSLTWCIKNFASLPSQHEVSTSVISTSAKAPKLFLTASWSDENLKGGGKLKMEVREMPELVGKNFQLACRIRLLDSKNKLHHLADGWYLFTFTLQRSYLLWWKAYTDSVWNFELDINRGDLYQRRDLYLRDGELVLECDFAISYDPLCTHLSDSGFVHPKPKPTTTTASQVVQTVDISGWWDRVREEFNGQNGIFKFFFLLILFLSIISRVFSE